VETGAKFGIKAQAVVSDMNQPLGQFVGNAHEIYECIKILRNEATEAAGPTTELSSELSSRMLLLCGVVDSIESARDLVDSKIANGEALERLRINIECQGGDVTVCDDPDKLLAYDIEKHEIKVERDGYLSAIDTLAIGNALSEIGGGRVKAEDKVDHAVGFESVARLGDRLSAGDVVGFVYARNSDQARLASANISAAYKTADVEAPPPPLVHAVIP
jgi:thymidine phosphorylase